MLTSRRLLLLLLPAAGLLPGCVGQPRLALNAEVPASGLLAVILLWLTALSIVVVALTGLTAALHRRQRHLLPPVARLSESVEQD